MQKAANQFSFVKGVFDNIEQNVPYAVYSVIGIIKTWWGLGVRDDSMYAVSICHEFTRQHFSSQNKLPKTQFTIIISDWLCLVLLLQQEENTSVPVTSVYVKHIKSDCLFMFNFIISL